MGLLDSVVGMLAGSKGGGLGAILAKAQQDGLGNVTDLLAMLMKR